MPPVRLPNFVGGTWRRPQAEAWLPVFNPATAEVLAEVPLSAAAELDEAVASATAAQAAWRDVPVTERVGYLFRYFRLLEEHYEELARTITRECGKTLAEARGELRRGLESVQAACALPLLLQGYSNEQLAYDLDEHLFRQPLGVAAAVTPFNFPAMIPLWFLPYAVGCGNALLLKPSERVPHTAVRLVELLAETGLPRALVQLLHGGQELVHAMCDHPGIHGISLVGSTQAARAVYQRAAAAGKRVQCQGGARNALVVMPDADLDGAVQAAADGAFGCAGQRCLATSLAIAVDQARHRFIPAIQAVAASRRVGNGLDPQVEMGPLITQESQARVVRFVAEAENAGAKPLLDGRGRRVPGYEQGFFVFPTVLAATADAALAHAEVFGPVLSLLEARNLDEALSLINSGRYGNMACLFTRDGAAARRFRYEAQVGNVGINVGVAAPMAWYPFSGWKESFFGDLHAQGRHAVEFYTQTKVVMERWPRGRGGSVS
ncbi:MAG: CoA-acylating methylmalonate-semialdehyde dehydrogenase [Pirellulales bacterium]|nr:CoA-acylating methylmalonate-semialdehyde dehydrogenase [Pirellulales bacterium]